MTWLRQLGNRGRAIIAVLAVVLVTGGIVAIVVAVKSQETAPQPGAGSFSPSDLETPAFSTAGSASTPSGSAASSTPSKTASSSAKPAPTPTKSKVIGPETKGPILKASKPTRVQVPAIGVDSNLLDLGLTAQNTIQVPPLSANSQAGWYKYSPEPGTLGPSIILGHIDSAAYGPGVFFKLGALHAGDMVYVTRADGTVAVFRVDGVNEYKKNNFPSLTVYGNTDNAALRLITCGGVFDESIHSYESNIVVYASLVSSHKAG